MNISDFPNLWFTLIHVPVNKIYDFLISDHTTAKYNLQYQSIEIGNFYMDNLHNKPSRDFMGAIFYNPVNSPANTIVIGNAGSWGTLSNYICSKLNARNYQFDINDEKSNFPRNTLMANESGKSIRFVQSMFSDEDNEWIFTEKGQPLWFENTDYYNRKEIASRLNKEILEEYCEKLGLPIRQDDFFKSDLKSLFVKYETSKR